MTNASCWFGRRIGPAGTGPNGEALSFSQAIVQMPSAFSFESSVPQPPSDIELVRVEIDGSCGCLMMGAPLTDDGGRDAGWDLETVIVGWQSGHVVYGLEARGLETDELLATARGLDAWPPRS